jgi:dihydrofolate reductase
MDQPRLVLIAAVAANGVIGRDGALPWRLKSDLAWFKRATFGKPVLMGRATWDSLPRRPLAGRANIVVSRRSDFRPEGAVACSDLETALAAARAAARAAGAEEVVVIGGAALYAQTLPYADRLLLTEVDASPAGDVVFPSFDRADWLETERWALPASEGDDVTATVVTLKRAQSS